MELLIIICANMPLFFFKKRITTDLNVLNVSYLGYKYIQPGACINIGTIQILKRHMLQYFICYFESILHLA